MEFQCKSSTYIFKGCKWPTTNKFFSSLEIGDIIMLEVIVKDVGRASRGSYAPVVTIYNLTKAKFTKTTFNLFMKFVDTNGFRFEEI